jgi:hypothetical protein
MPEFDPRHLHLMPYESAAPLIENASLLQYRGNAFFSRLIQIGTLGVHSHSAMVRRNGCDRIDVLEMVEHAGGRAQPLDGHVARKSGRIDVFRIRRDRWPEFDPDAAVHYMRMLTSRRYGRWGIIRLAAMRSFGLRLYFLLRGFPYDDDAQTNANPFCSHAVCSAYRLGGKVDPVPNKPDYLVTPNDLTWSLFFEYQFTLV